jgi:hypothetical protein
VNGVTQAYDIGNDTEAADVGALLDGLIDRHGLSFVVAEARCAL